MRWMRVGIIQIGMEEREFDLYGAALWLRHLGKVNGKLASDDETIVSFSAFV